MSTSKTPRAGKGSQKGTGSNRQGKTLGAPVKPSQPPGIREAAPKSLAPVSSVDLDAFQAKLEAIRKAIIEAIDVGIKLSVRSQGIGGTDLTDDMSGPGTTGVPEPTYPATTQGIKDLAAELLERPDLWFNSPNPRFGGRKPGDLLGTEDEIRVYWLLNAADQGMFS